MSTKTSTIELSRMTPAELRQDIALHIGEYAKMRMGIGMQKEKNHALFKSKRREIAKMKTVLTAMEANQKNGRKEKNETMTKSAPVSPETASKKVKKPVKVPSSK